MIEKIFTLIELGAKIWHRIKSNSNEDSDGPKDGYGTPRERFDRHFNGDDNSDNGGVSDDDEDSKS